VINEEASILLLVYSILSIAASYMVNQDQVAEKVDPKKYDTEKLSIQQMKNIEKNTPKLIKDIKDEEIQKTVNNELEKIKIELAKKEEELDKTKKELIDLRKKISETDTNDYKEINSLKKQMTKKQDQMNKI
jgi:septal ring factor EnvC (AmiA/AmiB activator)